jgi:hypothetical protein
MDGFGPRQLRERVSAVGQPLRAPPNAQARSAVAHAVQARSPSAKKISGAHGPS